MNTNIPGIVSIKIGLDLSTSACGVVIVDNNNTVVDAYAVKLTGKKTQDEYDKADFFMSQFEQRIRQKEGELDCTFVIDKIFIEEAAKKFSSGLSSAGTIMTLGRFNGIVSYLMYKKFINKPLMVNVRSARAKLGIKINYKDKSSTTKEKIYDFVKKNVKNICWTSYIAKSGKNRGKLVSDKTNFDIADAVVIALGGIKMYK